MIVKRGPFKRIFWGAVFAGVVIALVVQLLLSLLGLGIGFGSINPMVEAYPFEGLGTGALIWWAVSMIIALFVGGLAAGKLSGLRNQVDRVMHGVLSFSVYAIVTIWMLTTAVGTIISGVGSVVGQTLSLAGQGIGAVAPQAIALIEQEMEERGIDMETIRQEAEQILRETGKPELQPENLERRADRMGDTLRQQTGDIAQDPQTTGETTGNILERLFTEGGEVVDAADRDAAVNVVMQRTGQSRAEAERTVDNWIATYHDAREQVDTLLIRANDQAREIGDALASAASKASWFAFFGLLIGAVASGAGAGLVQIRKGGETIIDDHDVYRDPTDPGYRDTDYRDASYRDTEFKDPDYIDPKYKDSKDPGYKNTSRRDPGYKDTTRRDPGYKDTSRRDPNAPGDSDIDKDPDIRL
jgi:hypothetical protein